MSAPKPDPFESRLRSQALRQPPAEWKSEILAAAARAQVCSAVSPESRNEDGFYARLAAILWPSPVAWGALAAVWLALAVFKVAAPGTPPATANSSSSNSAFLFYAFREQNLLVRELIGPAETARQSERRRQEPPPAAPRSERRNPCATV
jgi:hypothetical protein